MLSGYNKTVTFVGHKLGIKHKHGEEDYGDEVSNFVKEDNDEKKTSEPKDLPKIEDVEKDSSLD